MTAKTGSRDPRSAVLWCSVAVACDAWTVPAKFGERGLARAVERLRQAVAASTEFDVPFFEVIAWVYALQQVHESAVGKTLFRNNNNQTPGGQTLRAIEWARTFVAHELLQVCTLYVSGMLGTTMLGTTMLGPGFAVPVWISDPSHKSSQAVTDDRAALYSELVAGRLLLEPILVVQAYLESLPPPTAVETDLRPGG